MGISISGGVKVPQGKFKVYVAPPPPPGNELWSMGGGVRIGDGTVIAKSSPVQIGSDTDWASSDGGGNFLHVIKTNGELWTWGDNSPSGQLGLGDVIDRSAPVQVGNLTDWASVNSGFAHTLAIKTDGTLWAWGADGVGALGQGPKVNRSSPIQVGDLTDWTSVGAGRTFSFAIKTNGSLWAWGQNTGGRLGLKDTINRSSPSQIGSLTNWSIVKGGQGGQTLAIKTNGTLWSWGYDADSFGRLGLNDVNIPRSSPVQVGSDTNWSSIGCGYTTSVATKTDGTLWVWGRGNLGRLGTGNTINRSSPVQIGSLSDWASVNQAGSFVHALKTDGTLWGWGANDGGAIGDGTKVTRNSPVQIGSLTTWTVVNSALNSTLALKTVT